MFKKKLVLMILAAAAIALFLPSGLTAGADLKIRVTVERANIRQSGFASAPVIGGGNKGEIFTVIEKAGDWYLIQLADGTPGFISAAVVEEVAETAPALPEEMQPVERTAAPKPAPAALPDQVVGESGGKNTFSMVLLRAGYFLASDAAYKDVYENGLVFGGEVRVGGQSLAGWVEGNYRSATGKTTYTEEETKMSVLAFEGGALYRFEAGMISPYFGAGLGMYMFKESNEPMGEAKQSKLGFCGLGGVAVGLGSSFILDARLKYSTCSMKPADFDINVGGLTLGIGLGMKF